MANSVLDFDVQVLDPKVKAAKTPDTRSFAERMFTIVDKETGNVKPMPLNIIDCSYETAAKQGHDGFSLNGSIPVLLNYMGAKSDFEGVSKGRDMVKIGARSGKGGSSGLLLDVAELPQTIELLQQLHNKLKDVVPATREKLGIRNRPVAQASTPKGTKSDKAETIDLDDGIPQ